MEEALQQTAINVVPVFTDVLCVWRWNSKIGLVAHFGGMFDKGKDSWGWLGTFCVRLSAVFVCVCWCVCACV